MKRLAAAGAAILAALALTSCSPGPSEPTAVEAPPAAPVSAPSGVRVIADYDYQFSVWEVDVNGKKVTCVWHKDGYGGGLSCDFAGHTR